MSDDTQKEKPKSVKWKCKVCSNTVVMYVQPSEPPTCNNKKHLTKSVPMERA
jgi:rubrerythrin